MIISTEIYYEIISKIRSTKGQFRELENQLVLQYGLPQNTISSIISNENKRNMRKNHHKMNNAISKFYERYICLRNSGSGPGIILQIAHEIDMSYSLVAKTILETHYEQGKNSESNINKNVKQYLKDSTLLDDKDLAYELYLTGTCDKGKYGTYSKWYNYVENAVFNFSYLKKSFKQKVLCRINKIFSQCQLYDSQYGCINDIIRHSLGQEYEFHLQEVIKEKNLSFQTEDDLRIYGYDKTPDIKLTIPFAVDGFVINWIESKALFGDPDEHENYMKDQYSSYWNRFGTGLVIYWLGMVESVIDPTEKRFIVRDDFPHRVTMTDPLVIAKIPPELESRLKK